MRTDATSRQTSEVKAAQRWQNSLEPLSQKPQGLRDGGARHVPVLFINARFQLGWEKNLSAEQSLTLMSLYEKECTTLSNLTTFFSNSAVL